MKKISVLLVLGLLFTACSSTKYSDLDDGLYADVQTTMGDMVIALHYDQTPVTVANFVSLAEGNNPYVSEEFKDKPYYNGVIFHRVIKDFMIQGGDPTATGSGGPGYKFKDEIVDSLVHDQKGILSMANAGPGTNGSQFFITHDSTPWLNGKHTVFGKVIKGLEVIDSIANVPLSTDPVTQNRPAEDVVIQNIAIVRKGRDAKGFDAVAVMDDYFREAEEAKAAMQKAKDETAAEMSAQKEQAQTTASGVKYIYLKESEGEKPAQGDMVMVNYAGYLTDGTLFDTSILEIAEKYGAVNPGKRDAGGYSPFPMKLDPQASMIPGFKEALTLPKYGEKVRVFIPAHLGYGNAGIPGVIPPGSELIFDIEILDQE